MRSAPTTLAITSTPEKVADIKTIGQKASIFCKSDSPSSVFIYLTETDAAVVTYSAFTAELTPGSLYETPSEHVGEVWAASSSASSQINLTQYG